MVLECCFFLFLYQKEEEESIEDLRAVSPTDKKPGFKMEKVGQVIALSINFNSTINNV